MQLAEQFDRAAGRYDVLTRLNPGYHGALRDAARALVGRLQDGTAPLRLWDLGCGSGLSTRALVDAAGPQAAVVGLDASAGMLEQAAATDWPAGVRFVQAYAQDLPRVAAEELAAPADGAFAAYLMRNVPEDQRERVFEPMVRLDKRVEGMGIGLATCRRVVDAHGGTIGVEASPSGGSAFWVELPA